MSKRTAPGKEAAKKLHFRFLHPDTYSILLALVVVFGVFLSYAFFYGPSPINGADNYLYADYAHQIYVGQLHEVAHNGVLAQQYLLLFGITFFYALFGIADRLTASMFGVLCFALTIVVLYKIGARLYSREAGLLSAFFYSFNPIAVVNSSYVGDNGPMALMVSLAVLFLVYAIKEKDRQRGRVYYALSGAFSIFGVLTTAQSILILTFAIPVVLFYVLKSRDRQSVLDASFFVAGILFAVAVIALLEMSLGNPPLYIFTLNQYTYVNTFASSQPQFQNYVIWFFPFGGLSTAASALNSLASRQPINSTLTILTNEFSNIFDTSKIQYFANQSDGLFGYLFVLGIIYLLFHGNLRFLMPAFWFVSVFLYMGFGTLSLSHYAPIGIAYARLMLIFLPAVCLVIGFAAADMLDRYRGVLKYASAAALVLVVAIALTNSLEIISFVNLSQYRYVYPLVEVAGFLDAIPVNITVYQHSVLPLDIYVSYKRYNMLAFPLYNNCTYVPTGSYVVLGQPNASIVSSCRLIPVFVASPPPAYLSSYNLFNGSSFGTYFNATVYLRSK